MKKIFRGIFLGILLLGCLAIVYYIVHSIYVENHKTIEERAYDVAVYVCEKDVLSSIDPIFEDYDSDYVRWVNEDQIEVKVIYHTYYNGIRKEVQYKVKVDVEDGKCYPNVPERVLE